MATRRLIRAAVPAGISLSLLFLSLPAQVASASPACPSSTNDVLLPADVPSGTDVGRCGLVGRTVRTTGGPTFAGARIPEPGKFVYAETLAVGGFAELTLAVSPAGILTVEQAAASTVGSDTNVESDSLVPEGECTTLDQPPLTGMGKASSATRNWYFRSEGIPATTTLAAARSAADAAGNYVETNKNRCDLADYNAVDWNYSGYTKRMPDIPNDLSSCGTSDGYNVVGFMSIDLSNVLAAACSWGGSTDGYADSQDISINYHHRWWTSAMSTCKDAWHLASVLTHERMHSAGLAHMSESTHPYYSISQAINGKCQTSETTLARGEIAKLNSMY